MIYLVETTENEQIHDLFGLITTLGPLLHNRAGPIFF